MQHTMGNGHGALTGFLKAYAVDALICGGIGASAGRYFQQIFQHKDSCKNAGTQQGNLNISADSCLSAAALPLGSDPALSDAGAVSIVFVNILLICIARMTLLLPPGLVFLLCCRRILRM